MNEPFEFLDEEEEVVKSGIAWLPLIMATFAVAGFLAIPVLGLFKAEKKNPEWLDYVQEEEIQVNREPDLVPEEVPAPVIMADSVNLLDDLVSVDETLAGLAATKVPPVTETIEKNKEPQPKATPKASRTITPVVKTTDLVAVKKPKAANPSVAASDKPAIKRPDPVAVKKPKVANPSVAASDKPAIKRSIPVAVDSSSTNARRAPTYQQPREESVSALSTPESPQSDQANPDETLAIQDPNYIVYASQPYEEEKGFRFSVTQKASKIISPTGKSKEPVAAIIQEVTVQPGDTLYRIASRNGITMKEMAQANQISQNDPIKPGQKLKVPNRNETVLSPFAQPLPYDEVFANEPFAREEYPSPKAGNAFYSDGPRTESYPIYPNGPVDPANSSPSPNPLDKYNKAIAYRVQLLDNMSRIADAHGTTPDELIQLNGRSSVKKGEMIVVPVDACLIKDK